MILAVDGDFLCYYQAYAMESRGAKLAQFTTTEFVQQCLRTLSYFCGRLLGNKVTHIQFFFDEGKSWRYSYLDKHNIVYKDRDKSKRELPNFNDYRRKLRDTLANHNFAIIAIAGYEADDGIHIATQMIESGEVCIATGDSDLQQELYSDDNKEVFILNPHLKDGFPLLRTAYQPVKGQQEADYFASDIPTKFIETVTNAKIVDPAEGLYVKMICGDSTDTIPSAFKYLDGEKARTVGEARAKNFHREQFPAPTLADLRKIYSDKQTRLELAQRILSFAKLKAFNKINDFEHGLYRNLRCIMLDDLIYEEHDLSSLKDKVAEQMKPSPGGDLVKIFRETEFDFTTNYYKN